LEVRARLEQADSTAGFSQESLYVERYHAGQWQTLLVNTYPTQTYSPDGNPTASYSVLDADLDLDVVGNTFVTWINNGEAWEPGDDRRLRTMTVLSTTVPQITKHYFAANQRVATQVDNNLYYTLSDPAGNAGLFVRGDGSEAGHVIFDSSGEVVTNTQV
jgi:hypothetical protein